MSKFGLFTILMLGTVATVSAELIAGTEVNGLRWNSADNMYFAFPPREWGEPSYRAYYSESADRFPIDEFHYDFDAGTLAVMVRFTMHTKHLIQRSIGILVSAPDASRWTPEMRQAVADGGWETARGITFGDLREQVVTAYGESRGAGDKASLIGHMSDLFDDEEMSLVEYYGDLGIAFLYGDEDHALFPGAVRGIFIFIPERVTAVVPASWGHTKAQLNVKVVGRGPQRRGFDMR